MSTPSKIWLAQLKEEVTHVEQQAAEEAHLAEEVMITEEAGKVEEARITEEARKVEEEQMKVKAERKQKEVKEECQVAINLAEYQ